MPGVEVKHMFPRLFLRMTICGIVFFSCHSNQVTNNQALTVAVKNALAADAGHKEAAVSVLDSIYFSTPGATPAEKLERFDLKAEFFLKTKKDYHQAMLCIDSLLAICEARTGDPYFAERKVSGLYTKGTIFYAAKNYDEALHYFVLSKRTGEELALDDCSYLGYSGIADLLYTQENYLQAATQFLENCRIEQKCRKDPWLKFVYMQGNLNSAGMCYEKTGLLDSAQYFYDSAQHYIEQQGRNFPENQPYVRLAKAVVQQGRASVLEKKGKEKEAENLYLSSIEGTRQDYIEFTNRTKVQLAGVYIENNQLAKAAPLLQELNNNLTTEDVYLQRLYKLQSDYYQKNNDYQTANVFLRKYITLGDSLTARGRRLSAMDVNYEFKMREQEMINDLLTSANKSKSFQLTALILLSILAVIIIAFVWYNLRRTGRHLKQLRHLNNVILQKNEHLHKAFISLEQSQEENRKITRMVIHDLKNPLAGIRTLVAGLLKKEQPEDLKQTLALIESASVSSTQLINDLMIEKTETDSNREWVDMKDLVDYSAGLLQAKANEKNQHLQVLVIPAWVRANRQKMWRVISNLLNNAIKFSPDYAEIIVQLEKKLESIVISVKDHGIGIPENLQDKILPMHPAASRRGTKGEESHGLGLLISMEIIREHGGRLWFESKEGEGTTFFVELPATYTP